MTFVRKSELCVGEDGVGGYSWEEGRTCAKGLRQKVQLRGEMKKGLGSRP